MRLILLGAGAFGLPSFRALAARHEIATVITQPDRPAGRRRKPKPTAIAEWAADAGLPVLRQGDVNEPAFVQQVGKLQADAAIVIAFGQKLGPELVKSLAPLAVNLHGSLLPAYRGAAPVNWAVIAGERETGNTVIGIAERMDAGRMYGQVRTAIDPLETAGELHDRLAALGPDLLLDVLDRHAAGTLEPVPQDDTKATRAPKLSKADAWVDFTEPADRVRSRIHGLTPWPGVTVMWHHEGSEPQPLILRRVRDRPNEPAGQPPGTILPNHHVATGQGVIQLLEVQPPGKRTMSITEFTRGHHLTPGDRFESACSR